MSVCVDDRQYLVFGLWWDMKNGHVPVHRWSPGAFVPRHDRVMGKIISLPVSLSPVNHGRGWGLSTLFPRIPPYSIHIP